MSRTIDSGSNRKCTRQRGARFVTIRCRLSAAMTRVMSRSIWHHISLPGCCENARPSRCGFSCGARRRQRSPLALRPCVPHGPDCGGTRNRAHRGPAQEAGAVDHRRRASEVRDELTANAARAELYRTKVSTLAQALEQSETRVEATEALGGLIDAIILMPSDGELRIELKGNLAAMLSAATNAKRSPETGDLSLQVEMVAGARTKLFRQLCWAAA
jgi:hypothetical protein